MLLAIGEREHDFKRHRGQRQKRFGSEAVHMCLESIRFRHIDGREAGMVGTPCRWVRLKPDTTRDRRHCKISVVTGRSQSGRFWECPAWAGGRCTFMT